MELLFEYKTKKKSIFIYLFAVCIMLFLSVFLAVETFITENQEIEIECIKNKNVCHITKGIRHKTHSLRISDINAVKTHCVGCTYGICRYDIEILFNNSYIPIRVLGAGFGSINRKEIERILNDFNNYLNSDKDYFYIKRRSKIVIPFDIYCSIVLLLLIPWLLYKFLPIKQRIFRSNRNILYIEKYNIFNHVYFKKDLKIDDIDRFEINKTSLYQFIICYIKDKPFDIFRLDDKIVAEKLCERLNALLKTKSAFWHTM